MAKKSEYFSGDRILATGAQYLILIGERANGKSYWVKHHCVKDAIDGNGELIYLRRWKLELKEDDVSDYFSDCDISKLSEGRYTDIKCSRGRIYALAYDDKGEVADRFLLGRTAALSGAEHLKSNVKRGAYANLIYEEFSTKNGYLGSDEPSQLQQFVSTVFGRDNGKIWLIANTVSRYNPYYNEWQLRQIQTMQPGDLDIYEMATGQYLDDGSEYKVRLAVEFCETTSGARQGKLFFGNSAKNINTGVWETEVCPHIPEPFDNFKLRYQIYLKYKDMGFSLKVIQHRERSADYLLFICSEEEKPKRVKRWISDEVTTDPLQTTKLLPLTGGDRLTIDLLKRGKIVYATNLTGTDFKAVLHDNKFW